MYRQSTENLTRHRLNIIESAKPDGYDTYQQDLEAAKEKAGIKGRKDSAFELSLVVTQARTLLETLEGSRKDRTVSEYLAVEKLKWDFPVMSGSVPTSTSETAKIELSASSDALADRPAKVPPIGALFEPGTADGVGEDDVPLLPLEPELTAEQVSELEEKLGSGLIEEVIDQGWAELKLIVEMESAKVWEELEEVPKEGQWVGFEKKP